MAVDSELSIRVRRIDDLMQVGYGADYEGRQVCDGDRFLVSHPTNQGETPDGEPIQVSRSRQLTLEDVKQFIADYVVNERLKGGIGQIEIGDLKDGESFMEEVQNKIDGILTQSTDSYTGNCYFKEEVLPVTVDGCLRSAPFEFTEDTNAFIHATINQISSITSAVTDTVVLMMNSQSGDKWVTICEEPVRRSANVFDIDLHGYFFAGTQIMISSHSYSSKGHVINNQNVFGDSVLKVT